MERNTSEIADTSSSDQMSLDDQKGQLLSQADTKTIQPRTMDKPIFIVRRRGDVVNAIRVCLDFTNGV